MMLPSPLKYDENSFEVLDQRLLPNQEVWLKINSLEDTYKAIAEMVVRGAPLIGFTATLGLAFWLKNQTKKISINELKEKADYLKKARPTAVNLKYELDNLILKFDALLCGEKSGQEISNSKLFHTAFDYFKEQINKLENTNLFMAKEIKKFAGSLGKNKVRVATICNTGRLACGTLGTALGAISYLAQNKMIEEVFAFETRPYLQGSRLTAYELAKEKIPFKLLVEGSMAYAFQKHQIDFVVVGADRVVANGDTANKIGTYTLALTANHFSIPFFVLAPLSSFDMELEDGAKIKIEERDSSEILKVGNTQLGLLNAPVWNPSFDVTPAKLITGIISEKGTYFLSKNKFTLSEFIGIK